MRTVLRGGDVIDGTGGPARAADVVIEDDRIAAVAEPGAGHGDAVVDLDGLVLSPGFIDLHTHFDAQIFWDPDLTPSSWHGVTSVVMGNCGFGIAPTHPSGRETIARTLENVEGMSLDALQAGIPWGFESFPEYLDAVIAQQPRLNVGAFIGHSPLRLYVLGDAASERAASADEIATMRRLVGEAVEHGAIGFATSQSPSHVGAYGAPVPSRLADFDEIAEIASVLGELGAGIVQVARGPSFETPQMSQLAHVVGRPLTWTALVTGRGPTAAVLDRQTASGGEVYPQVTCRPLALQMQLINPFAFGRLPAFAAMLGMPIGDRRACYLDEAWRDRARRELDAEWPDIFRRVTIEESVVHAHLNDGPTVAQLAAERRADPFDTMCEIGLAEDLTTRFRVIISNDNEGELAYLLRDPRTVLGLSDAGAHADQLCDACFSTHLLEHWVRDMGTLPLEQAVWKLTGQPAAVLQLDRRGTIAAGNFADLVAFDKDTVGVTRFERIHDLPTGAERLVAYSTGIEHVWINGTVTRRHGEDLPEVRPGRLLRTTSASTR